MKRSAVAYIRASTDDQVNTLAVQQQRLQHYCALHEITLVQSFFEAGVSGSETFADRPEAGAMLEFMELAGITEIVFTTVDRAFRRTADALQTFADFQERGIRCHAIDMQIDTGSAMGRFILGVRFLIAELELNQRAERQRVVIDHLAANNRRIGEIPYGWLGVADPNLRASRRGNAAMHLIADPTEQQILRRIVDMAGVGHSPAAIARQLNAEGIPAKKGGRWHAIVIAGILESPRLAEDDSQLPVS